MFLFFNQIKKIFYLIEFYNKHYNINIYYKSINKLLLILNKLQKINTYKISQMISYNKISLFIKNDFYLLENKNLTKNSLSTKNNFISISKN